MGPEVRAAIILNATFVRPAKFYLNGFTNMPHEKYYYVFLCFVYVMTVLGNGLLLTVIYLVEALHTPKYMLVFNLAFADLCGSTALIPKLLETFLFNKRYIVYEACLSYMFFVLFFISVQSWTLVAMAYDRLIAICFPLRYHSIVTKLYISFSHVYELVAAMIIIWLPPLLIAVTYFCIFTALSRIASGEERLKALKTCSSHLILVALFFFPIIGTNIASQFSFVHPNARIVGYTLTNTIPALLNPIVYALKTEEVLNSLKKLCKRNSINNTSSSRKVKSVMLLS
ncbi:olfactory receptor 8B8-like [Labrus bergylta]|uniref:olfactory receptor 8B8-like n=1 Tax=Labrus bergylta TaxID=56723 RepID=UPI003313A501